MSLKTVQGGQARESGVKGGGSAASTASTLFCIANIFPDGSHPGARQKRPLGLNRFVILTILGIYTLVSSCVYFGWPSVTALLYGAEAYVELCRDAVTGEIPNDLRLTGKPYACDAQDTQVNSLFTTTFAAHMIVGAVSGFIIAKAGPRITAFIGQAMNIAAWVLLALAGPNSAMYMWGFICLGCGAGMTFLPSMTFVNLFPGSSALFITILGSAASGSYVVPLILEITLANNPTMTAQWLFLAYGVFGCGACAVCALVMFPSKHLVGEDAWDAIEKRRSHAIAKDETQGDPALKNIDLEIGSYVHGIAARNDPAMQDPSHLVDPSNMAYPSHSDTRTQNPARHPNDEQAKPSGPDTDISRAKTSKTFTPGKSSRSSTPRDVVSSSDDEFNDYINVEGSDGLGIIWPGFRKQFLSMPYGCILMYSMGVNMVVLYILMASGRLFTPIQQRTLGILLPLQFIPCIGIGHLMDVVGIQKVLIGINTCGIGSLLLLIVGTPVSEYLAIILFSVYASVQTSQTFCYLSKTFNSKHFEKLTGVASMLTGLFGLAVNPIYDLTVVYLRTPIPVIACFTGLLVLLYIPLGLMLSYHRKHATKFQPTTD